MQRLSEKEKKRPLKVTFMNKQMVTDVIKKAKVLASHEEYKKIWIRENMTKDDRKKRRQRTKLNKGLRKKRHALGG